LFATPLEAVHFDPLDNSIIHFTLPRPVHRPEDLWMGVLQWQI
jgi:hypothetical protein